jgi:hypothetical protein
VIPADILERVLWLSPCAPSTGDGDAAPLGSCDPAPPVWSCVPPVPSVALPLRLSLLPLLSRLSRLPVEPCLFRVEKARGNRNDRMGCSVPAVSGSGEPSGEDNALRNSDEGAGLLALGSRFLCAPPKADRNLRRGEGSSWKMCSVWAPNVGGMVSAELTEDSVRTLWESLSS